MFLTPADLIFITGYQRSADQRRWLTQRGWVFEVSRAGFRALISRIRPEFDLGPIETVEKKLAAGVPLVEAELDTVLRLLHRIEDSLVGIRKDVLQDAVLVEQINIEIDSLGIRDAA